MKKESLIDIDENDDAYAPVSVTEVAGDAYERQPNESARGSATAMTASVFEKQLHSMNTMDVSKLDFK
jgi:hypothetical protein